MYTPEHRDQLRAKLLDRAKADNRITGAAITGSAAANKQDDWSDIDLAFGISTPQAIEDWTSYLYADHGALHHVDIPFGAWLYRVFLLPGTLQVDLAFAPSAEFRPLAPTFQLVFGDAQSPLDPPPANIDSMIGMGWLYALHARTCIARNKPWQAEYMIAGVRNTALSLACARHGLSTYHAKGVDELPSDLAANYEGTLARSLESAELSRAFHAAVERLMDEISRADRPLADRLESSLRTLY